MGHGVTSRPFLILVLLLVGGGAWMAARDPSDGSRAGPDPARPPAAWIGTLPDAPILPPAPPPAPAGDLPRPAGHLPAGPAGAGVGAGVGAARRPTEPPPPVTLQITCLHADLSLPAADACGGAHRQAVWRAQIGQVAARLRVRDPPPLTVRFTGRLPGAAAGMLTPAGVILIDASRTPPHTPAVDAVLVHEAAHALLRHTASHPLPRWLEEAIVAGVTRDLIPQPTQDATLLWGSPRRSALDAWPARVADARMYADAAQVGRCLLALLDARAGGARPWMDADRPLDADALAQVVGLADAADLIAHAAAAALGAPPVDAPHCAAGSPPRVRLAPLNGQVWPLAVRQPLLAGPARGPATVIAALPSWVALGYPPRADGAPVWWSGAAPQRTVTATWTLDLTTAAAAALHMEVWDARDPTVAPLTLTLTAPQHPPSALPVPWQPTPAALGRWQPVTIPLPEVGRIVTVTLTMTATDHRPGHGIALAVPEVHQRAAGDRSAGPLPLRRDPLPLPTGNGIAAPAHGGAPLAWRVIGVAYDGGQAHAVPLAPDADGWVRWELDAGVWGALVLVPTAQHAVGETTAAVGWTAPAP